MLRLPPLLLLLAVSCLRDDTIVEEYRAHEFNYISKNCRAWIEESDDSNWQSAYTTELNKRGWKPVVMKQEGRLFEGGLYFVIERVRERKRTRYAVEYGKDGAAKRVEQGKTSLVFKDCRVSVELRQSAANRVQKSDKVLYRGNKVRSNPRVTRQGDERCSRALKEAFLDIPYCLTPQAAEELKKKFRRGS